MTKVAEDQGYVKWGLFFCMCVFVFVCVCGGWSVMIRLTNFEYYVKYFIKFLNSEKSQIQYQQKLQ